MLHLTSNVNQSGKERLKQNLSCGIPFKIQLKCIVLQFLPSLEMLFPLEPDSLSIREKTGVNLAWNIPFAEEHFSCWINFPSPFVEQNEFAFAKSSFSTIERWAVQNMLVLGEALEKEFPCTHEYEWNKKPSQTIYHVSGFRGASIRKKGSLFAHKSRPSEIFLLCSDSALAVEENWN